MTPDAMAELRVIFMGTAPLARVILDALSRFKEADVVCVVTQPDRPAGRNLKPTPSAVKELAVQLGVPVFQPERLRRPEAVAHLAQLKPDLIVVAAYGQILPQSVLDLPPHGCLNVHASLLPKYRGASPIQHALLNGEPETGVTIIKMDAGMDTGPMLARRTTPISDEDNALTLHDRLGVIGAGLLLETIPPYVTGKLVPEPQSETGVSYARKIEKTDGRLDWNKPARELWNRVRAFTPWPGAFTHLPSSDAPALLKVLECRIEEGVTGEPGTVVQAGPDRIVVACGAEGVRITALQREGGRRLDARSFLAGHPLPPGTRFV